VLLRVAAGARPGTASAAEIAASAAPKCELTHGSSSRHLVIANALTVLVEADDPIAGSGEQARHSL